MNDSQGATLMGDEIARKGAIGEGSDSWNTRRMNTMEVESVMPISNGGEPLAALPTSCATRS